MGGGGGLSEADTEISPLLLSLQVVVMACKEVEMAKVCGARL